MSVGRLHAELGEHIARLRRYARALTRDRDAAEDLVQECLKRAIENAPSIRADADLWPWLFRIIRNLHLSAYRRESTVRRVRALTLTGEAAPPDQVDRLLVREVLDAFARLPEAQRQALELVAIDGLRYGEAAAILELPLGTFMSRLARGREALRAMVAGEDDGAEGAPAPRLRLVRNRP